MVDPPDEEEPPPVEPEPEPVGPLVIDISHWQPDFTLSQWRAFADEGVAGVIPKVGGANGKTVYVDYTDPEIGGNWSNQVTGAEEAGMPVLGGYWFNGRAAPIPSQVQTFLSAKVQGRDYGIRPGEKAMWDVEGEGTLTRWTPSETLEAAREAARLGKPYEEQLLYLSSSVTFEGNWSELAKRGVPLMVAHYVPKITGQIRPYGKILVNYWRHPNIYLWQFTTTPGFKAYDAPLDTCVWGDYADESGPSVWTVYDLQVGINKVLDLKLTEDGEFGGQTSGGVYALQKHLDLIQDGKAGTNTLTGLWRELTA